MSVYFCLAFFAFFQEFVDIESLSSFKICVALLGSVLRLRRLVGVGLVQISKEVPVIVDDRGLAFDRVQRPVLPHFIQVPAGELQILQDLPLNFASMGVRLLLGLHLAVEVLILAVEFHNRLETFSLAMF